MAVPFINIFANTMGGIGTIELKDFDKLVTLKEQSGISFYAGRYYPEKTADAWNFLSPGFISETPPWLTWADMGITPIVFVANFPDEYIVSTTCAVTSIDVWPRDPEDDADIIENLGEIPTHNYHKSIASANGPWKGLINDFDRQGRDPGFKIKNTVLDFYTTGSSILTGAIAGGLGNRFKMAACEIRGICTDFGFYDHEVIILNGYKYKQAQYKARARLYDERFIGKEVDYQEIFILRADGVWKKQDAEISSQGQPVIEYTNGYPAGGFVKIVNGDVYNDWVITDPVAAKSYGVEKWKFYFEINNLEGYEVPTAGVVMKSPTSKLDTLVYTIRASVVSVIIPDAILLDPDSVTINALASVAVDTFGANFFNNIWYFYMPVRFSGTYSAERATWMINQGAVSRLQAGLLQV